MKDINTDDRLTQSPRRKKYPRLRKIPGMGKRPLFFKIITSQNIPTRSRVYLLSYKPEELRKEKKTLRKTKELPIFPMWNIIHSSIPYSCLLFCLVYQSFSCFSPSFLFSPPVSTYTSVNTLFFFICIIFSNKIKYK